MVKKIAHYRPHKRVQFDGRLLDHRTGEYYKPKVRVQQQFADASDINNIVKMYKKTGQIQHMSAAASRGMYMDLPDETDFQQSLNTIIRAEDAFMSLPAHVRDRFQNDPSQFLEFMTNPANQDEAIKLGLVTDKRPPNPPIAPEGQKAPQDQKPGGAGETPANAQKPA